MRRQPIQPLEPSHTRPIFLSLSLKRKWKELPMSAYMVCLLRVKTKASWVFMTHLPVSSTAETKLFSTIKPMAMWQSAVSLMTKQWMNCPSPWMRTVLSQSTKMAGMLTYLTMSQPMRMIVTYGVLVGSVSWHPLMDISDMIYMDNLDGLTIRNRIFSLKILVLLSMFTIISVVQYL